MSFAARIKQCRESLRLSQVEMAERGGVSVRSYQAYERGESWPGGDVLARYCDLGIDMNWLLAGQGRMMISEAEKAARADDVPPLQSDIVAQVLMDMIPAYARQPSLIDQSNSWWLKVGEQFVNAYAFRWGMHQMTAPGGSKKGN